MCKAPRGEWCRYVPLKPEGEFYSARQVERARLNGQPTKRIHTERFNALWKQELRDRRNAYQERVKEDVHVSRMRRAYADEVRRETEQLCAWLRQHGRVLWS